MNSNSAFPERSGWKSCLELSQPIATATATATKSKIQSQKHPATAASVVDLTETSVAIDVINDDQLNSVDKISLTCVNTSSNSSSSYNSSYYSNEVNLQLLGVPKGRGIYLLVGKNKSSSSVEIDVELLCVHYKIQSCFTIQANVQDDAETSTVRARVAPSSQRVLGYFTPRRYSTGGSWTVRGQRGIAALPIQILSWQIRNNNTNSSNSSNSKIATYKNPETNAAFQCFALP